MPQPAKKATKKVKKPEHPQYIVISDRCTHGRRGAVVELAVYPRALIAAGHLRKKG